MTDYGIKVAKPGKSVASSDPRDIGFSSANNMLKYHLDETHDVVYHPGDTDNHVDIVHGLAYTPAFIAYVKDVNGNFRFIPSAYQNSGVTNYPYAYSDSTKVRCGYAYLSGAYSQYNQTAQGYWSELFGIGGVIEVGKDTGTSANGAMRFDNITIPQGTTITEATIHYYLGAKGATTTSLKYIVYGIAEDNTATFGGSPMARPKTTANHSGSTSMSISTGTYFGIDVLNEAQEIINRSGWSSGNAMGFLLFDNGTDNNCWAFDSGLNSYLTITYGANITLTFRCIIFKDKIT